MYPSHDARYDSSFAHKVKRVKCLENTRATVLEESYRWIYDFGQAKVFWLNGMAGTGKTTIAYTVCLELAQNRRLGASFFCSRAASDCQDVTRILPTIAYQLARQFYPFRSALYQKLSKEPNIGQRQLCVQFRYLIQEPLLEVKDVLPRGTVIVIDALDECTDSEATKLILNSLLDDAPQLPIRFFLTSRPEPSIVNAILERDSESRSLLHLHDVEEQLVTADIKTYLTLSLASIDLTLPQLQQLVEQAGVLFIYATTVTGYILSGPAGANRQARLTAVLSKDTGGRATKKDREIDHLYMTILNEVLKAEQLEQSEVDVIKSLLWAVTTVRVPVTITTLAGLLAVDTKAVSVALEPLRSVLNLIAGSNIVSPLHASFPEFILSPERSRQWSCGGEEYHQVMAIRCFDVMQDQLRFNICNLETSLRLDIEVPGLQNRVANAISPELFYACQYWSEHLRRSAICGTLLSCLNSFLLERLLFWMEVLNLKGEIRSGKAVLSEAEGWLSVSLALGSRGRN